MNEVDPHYTTGFNKTNKTTARRVLYDYHPWFGQEVLIEKVLINSGVPIARCHQLNDRHSIALELPLWVFDREACLSVYSSHCPHVDVSGLSALHFLLSQITKASEFDLSSSDPDLSADFMSGDQNQGGDHASISTKPRAAIESIQPDEGPVSPSDTAMANITAGDAHQNNQINGTDDDGTRRKSSTKRKHRSGHCTLEEGER